MMKKVFALALALSFATLAMAPSADAKRGRGGADNPPECEIEDGVTVCK